MRFLAPTARVGVDVNGEWVVAISYTNLDCKSIKWVRRSVRG